MINRLSKFLKIRLIPLILSLSSFSGILLFLFIGKKIDVPFLWVSETYFAFLDNNQYLYMKYWLFLIFVLFLAWFSIWITKKCLSDEDSMQIDEIKPTESTFLPVYIGLFVIALSFSEKSITLETWFLILILFWFWLFLEEVSYFNPFLLFFGYRFYEVKSKGGTIFTLITKRKSLKKIDKTQKLIRINNFTFLEQ